MNDNNLWLRTSLQNINEGLKDQDPKLIKAFAETLSPDAITGLVKISNALNTFWETVEVTHSRNCKDFDLIMSERNLLLKDMYPQEVCDFRSSLSRKQLDDLIDFNNALIKYRKDHGIHDRGLIPAKKLIRSSENEEFSLSELRKIKSSSDNNQQQEK